MEDDIFVETHLLAPSQHPCIPSRFSSVNLALEVMDISGSADKLKLVFHPSDCGSTTPWHIANTAKARANNLLLRLTTDNKLRENLLLEIREILSLDPAEFDCSLLLSPILTVDSCPRDESDSLACDEKQDDVLVLFGSPASAFQLFFSIPCLQSNILNILVESVTAGSTYSLQLLSQLLNPVGLNSFYNSSTDVEDVVTRLIEIFKITHLRSIRCHILQMIPDLLATPVNTLQHQTASEVIFSAMQKVVDLLESVVLLPNDGESERLSGYPLATEIIECVCQFPLEGPTLMRLKTACKRLLSQSVDSSSSQQQMANLIRCLFTNKLSKLFNCEDLMEFVPLLRQRIRLSELVTSDDISLLFDTLSLIFRSNCPLKLQWISYLYREYSKSDSGYDSLFDDLLILLLANGTELSVESNPDATVSIKRKEVSLVLKTLGPVAERIASFESVQSISNHFKILGSKQLFPSLITLTGHLTSNYPTPQALRFVFLIYSCVFSFCEPGGEQSSMVVMQLCNTICPSMPKTSGRPQVAKKTAIILDIVLQLSKAFSEKLSPFSDILLTLVDRISTSEGGEGRQPDIPDLRDIRKLYAILVYTAFWGRNQAYLQDDLLIIIRRQLLNRSCRLRTVGLIGAVTVLEMLCRKQKRPENEGLINNTPMSQIENVECSQSGVLASQIIPVNSQVPGSPNSSRNSYGHLSLKGPGTSLADDSQEINLPIESELDSENQESGRAFLPQPSRLILQLVGLVENAIRQTQLTQLKVLWLDELAAMFARLEETMRQGDASLATNAKTFIDWMGSRVMREFQEEFVVDNAATPGNETHLALNRREICEIALNVGPAFTRHMASTASTRPLLLTQVGNQTSHKRPRLSAPRNLCPSLIPCHLHLLAVVESTRSNRSLDAMNAIMGCPFLLPTVRLNDIPSQLLAVTINCCIESVNIFANRMALLATSKAVRRNILDHPLASTFVCRLIQIATLRFCMHTLLLSKSRDAALSAATLDMPKPASETLKTMTYDPDFVALPLARRATCPPSVKSVLLFEPAAAKHVRKNKGGSKSRKKAANTSTGDMKKRACATSRDLSRRGDEGDSSEDTDSSSTGGTTELDNDDPETMAVNRQAEKTGNTGVGTMSEKYSGLVFDPLLISMTICFRELELAAILIGLQSPLQPPRDFKFPQATDDILELPISEAINSIHDISKVKHAGKEKPLDVHLDWITIFYLLHDLKLKVDHMFGADLRHVTGWYAFERLDALSTPLRQLYLLALIPCLVNIVNSLTLYFKDVSGEETEEDHFVNLPRSQSNLFLGDCLSAGIYCLTALSTGIPPSVNLLRSPEALISRAQNLSNACLSRLRHLAVCLDDHRLAPVTVAKTIIGQGQLPAISMLDEDELELSTIGKPTSVSEEANDQKPSAAQTLRVIQWLIRQAPSGLVHAPSTFVHCCFVLTLSRYFNSTHPTESNDYEHPNLVDYTHSLLKTTCIPTAVWQDIPHKDYLCAIVAMHLHSPFFGPCSTPVDDCLGIFLNLIKSNLLPILLQQPKNQVDPCGHLRYSNLTSHNVGMYGKKLLEALCSCVRKLAKQTMNAGKSTSVIDLLTQWNSCVGTLVSITDVTKDACGGDIPPSRAFFDLLPGLMRTGRVFLENLLRCAMPFFNALFRTHASEVLAFLRNVQQLTRFLQRTCVHAKTRREARLTPLIPQTRKCLEAFVYSVKLLLSQNKCVDAFWLGNLKNRDLSGQEVGFKELSTRHSTQISGASAGSSLPGSQVTGGFSIEVDEHDEETESSRDAIANAKSDIEDDDVEESTDISDDYEEDDGDGKEIF